ncbi:MAG: hypothetical protein BWK73_10520 [Thiothrix lacustris]|uniref:Uncharacterized protein n=1 Tax=Thiothrix lacustris TaxID=525917 RepID=A0A1Y1QUQ6_9GAMM|nr:MAG: hypothetical protein BWK73_10520 [Thiothrix lacustris]
MGLGEPSVGSSTNASGSVSSPSAVSDSVGQGSATNSDSGVAPAPAGNAAVTPRGLAGNKAKPVGGVMQDTDSLGDGDAGGGKPLA